MTSPPTARVSIALGLALALVPFGSEALAEEPVPTPVEDHALARLITARLRIRPAGDVAFGHCSDLDLDSLELRLRGRRLSGESVVLERDRPPTVHALLIDASRSMIGTLDSVRSAAQEYVSHFEPGIDRGLVVTFDDDVILEQAVTADQERLTAAIRRVELGSNTALLDAMVDVLEELATHRGRRIVLLLSDGVDSASLNDRHDVAAIARSLDARVFTIGFQLPPLGAAGRGVDVTRSFLQRLAEKTEGEFFDTPHAQQIAETYRRVRELVEGEAALHVLDPDPQAAPARLEVRSQRSGCKVEMLGAAVNAPSSEWVSPPWSSLPRRVGLEFSESWRQHLNRAHHDVAGPCGGEDRTLAADPERLGREAWFVEIGSGAIRGCALDVRRDRGLLYEPINIGWMTYNSWLELETRPFEIGLPAWTELPERPEQVLDALAEETLTSRASTSVSDTNSVARSRPEKPDGHAIRHGGYASLVSGRTFLEMRNALARMAFAERDYRDWTLAKLAREAEAELDRVRERYRRRLPGVDDATIEAAIAASEEGRAILDEARYPSIESLERHLAAWLGDLSAYELFTAWEARHVERLASQQADAGYAERWRALLGVFRVPSYNRVLTLLAPVRDRARDAVGYWRIVLPRLSWFLPRMPGFENHPEWSDVPLDLVPDFPFAYLALEQALRSDAALREVLSASRMWRADSPRYELTGRVKDHTPVRAYESARVTLTLWRADQAGEGLELTADIGLDKQGEPIAPLLSWRRIDPPSPD